MGLLEGVRNGTINEQVEAARSDSLAASPMAAIVARRGSGESAARCGLADAAGPWCAEASVFEVWQPSRCRSVRWTMLGQRTVERRLTRSRTGDERV
jgi:hypothetical protein